MGLQICTPFDTGIALREKVGHRLHRLKGFLIRENQKNLWQNKR
jgi:hypothetical protein